MAKEDRKDDYDDGDDNPGDDVAAMNKMLGDDAYDADEAGTTRRKLMVREQKNCDNRISEALCLVTLTWHQTGQSVVTVKGLGRSGTVPDRPRSTAYPSALGPSEFCLRCATSGSQAVRSTPHKQKP